MATRGAFAAAIRSTGLAAMPKRLKIVRVNDKMQRGYRYVLTAPIGRNFDPEFRPELTPKEMLALGVFCGKYMTDCRKEFPASWFAHARLSPSGRDCSLNYFGVDASQPLSVWRDNGWIHHNDPRGWFQWYCRYYMGRRMPQEDARQIKRWKAIRRHVAQIKKRCEPGDQMCRPRQRQAYCIGPTTAAQFEVTPSLRHVGASQSLERTSGISFRSAWTSALAGCNTISLIRIG